MKNNLQKKDLMCLVFKYQNIFGAKDVFKKDVVQHK
jgi:hypothetical protein